MVDLDKNAPEDLEDPSKREFIKKNAIYTICGVIATVSLPTAYATYNRMSDSRSILEDNPFYLASEVIDDIVGLLSDSKEELVCTATGSGKYNSFFIGTNDGYDDESSYPDPKNTRESIDSVFLKIKELETILGLSFMHAKYYDISDELKTIYDYLPEKYDLWEFEGKPVDNSTFETQRDSIDEIISEFRDTKTNYLRSVPKELIELNEESTDGFIMSSIALLGALAAFIKVKYNIPIELE